MKTFRKGGIHPPEEKLTSGSPVTEIETPAELCLLLSQCIGAPSKCIVRPGDSVARGQKIAEAGGFVGAPVHSPVDGKVKRIEKVRTLRGTWGEAIIIETAPAENSQQPDDTPERTLADALRLPPEELRAIIADAGTVGLGGATFPTRVKLTVPEGKCADFIIINGAECEPYLTCDDRLMQESPQAVLAGTRLIMRAASAPAAIIGIEENKPEAIAAMRAACAGHHDISVVTLRKKYPQGSEKQLVEALTGRRIPPGALPLDKGCIVDNVATAAAVFDAVCHSRPLTRRIVTVTGPSVARPGNYLVPFGTRLRHLIEAAGGLPDDTGKVIAGGPMMGQAVADLDAPTVKGLSGLLLLPDSLARRSAPQPCVRCARCVDACPMGLSPYLLVAQSERALWAEARANNVTSCLECGSCNYICPSGRPLLDFIRLAKAEARKL